MVYKLSTLCAIKCTKTFSMNYLKLERLPIECQYMICRAVIYNNFGEKKKHFNEKEYKLLIESLYLYLFRFKSRYMMTGAMENLGYGELCSYFEYIIEKLKTVL